MVQQFGDAIALENLVVLDSKNAAMAVEHCMNLDICQIEYPKDEHSMNTPPLTKSTLTRVDWVDDVQTSVLARIIRLQKQIDGLAPYIQEAPPRAYLVLCCHVSEL